MEYRPCVREEFATRCVYCLARETDVAPGELYGAFQVDHFLNKALFDDSWTLLHGNLLWSCARCNRRKNRWPSQEEQANGYTYVHPCNEPLGDHLELVGLDVQAKTSQGKFMVRQLDLNGDLHRVRREARRRRELTKAQFLKLDETKDASKHKAIAKKLAELPAMSDPPLVPRLSKGNCLCRSPPAARTPPLYVRPSQ